MTPFDRIALVLQAVDGRPDLQSHALAFIAALSASPDVSPPLLHVEPPAVLAAGHVHRFIRAWRGVPNGHEVAMQIWDCACGARKFEPLDPSSGAAWIEDLSTSGGSLSRVLIDDATIDLAPLIHQSA